MRTGPALPSKPYLGCHSILAPSVVLPGVSRTYPLGWGTWATYETNIVFSLPLMGNSSFRGAGRVVFKVQC